MAVWIKVVLLIIYLSVLFILARLLEAISVFENGQLSQRLLDPMALSVLKLKALLDERGVSYGGLLEKTELKDLVEATGSVTIEELETVEELEDTPVTNYTSDIHFYEQVEDAKDSMWLIEVVDDKKHLLSDASWSQFQKKFGKFGVRFGRFDCQMLNVRLCTRKGWLTSRLVLALPKNYHSKANVALLTYPGPIRVNSLFEWIKDKVGKQIREIQDNSTLENNWLSFSSAISPDIRVIFVSNFANVPLFLSALSVKFTGRAKIGSLKVSSFEGKQLAKRLGVNSVPAYVVLTQNKKYFYGKTRGEIPRFKTIEMFLKSVYPSMNDVFIISIILTNIASLFEFSQRGLLRQCMKLIFSAFKYNLILILLWIGIVTLSWLPLFEYLTHLGLIGLRYITLTRFFAYIRQDILYYSCNIQVPVILLVSLILAGLYIRSKFFLERDDTDDEADWWNFSNLRTLNYHNNWEMMRLRPFDQIFNPAFAGQSVIHVFETTPTLSSNDYIRFLPIWAYTGPGQTCTCSGKMNIPVNNQGWNTETEICQNLITDDSSLGKLVDIDHSGSEGENSRRNFNLVLLTEKSLSENLFLQEFYKKRKHEKYYGISPEGYRKDEKCVICLEKYQTDELLCGLPCKHVFHHKCILSWLLLENHQCPVCRWPSFQPKESGSVNDLHSE